jgi:tight adherence protein C
LKLDALALIIAGGFTVALAAVAAMVAAIATGPRGAARRLRPPSAPEAPADLVRKNDRVARAVAQGLGPIARLAQPARADELTRLRVGLSHAGIRSAHALPIFLATKVLLALACLGVVLWVNAVGLEPLPMAPAWMLGSAAAGLFAPNVWVHLRASERKRAIGRGLPDALDLLVTCVEAGLGLDAALQRVAGEITLAQRVLGEELALTFLEVKAGVRRVDAFRRLAERTGVSDLKTLAATLNQTDMFGTSVATALRVQSESMRIRRMQRAEERAAMLTVKMAMPLVLCFLPALLVVVAGPAVVNVVNSFLSPGAR